MKTNLIISSVVVLVVGLTSMQEVALPKVSNNSFQTGEKLRYRITYGFVDAGEAVLEVKETTKKGSGNRELYHIKGTGRTLGGFNAVYKVNDVYESYIDKKGIFPWQFVRRVEEGGYKLYARTLNFKSAKVGDTFEFKCFMDDEIWPLKVKYLGDEKISIRKGKFNCMKFAPVVQTGRVFKKQDDLSFWVTKDENRIPILVKAKIPVGSIKLHLVEWSGLKHDLVKAK